MCVSFWYWQFLYIDSKFSPTPDENIGDMFEVYLCILPLQESCFAIRFRNIIFLVDKLLVTTVSRIPSKEEQIGCLTCILFNGLCAEFWDQRNVDSELRFLDGLGIRRALFCSIGLDVSSTYSY